MKRQTRTAASVLFLAVFWAAGPVQACFFHSPLLSVKDPYKVVEGYRRDYRVEIEPEKYLVIGEGEDEAEARRRNRLACLKRTRDGLIRKIDAILQDPSGAGKTSRPDGLVMQPSGQYVRTEGLDLGGAGSGAGLYAPARAWLEAFPFSGEDPGRIPAARIDDLERVLEAFPRIVRAHLYKECIAGFTVLAENLVFLDAGNISAAEFPNFKEWRGDIPRVLKLMREAMSDGGAAGAEVAVRTLVFRWTSCPEIEKGNRIKARTELEGDMEWILKRIGPRDAIPPLIAALPLVDAETRRHLVQTIKEIGKKGAPPKKGTPQECVAWYEEHWGAWPESGAPLLDLTPVTLIPKPNSEVPDPADSRPR